MVFVLFVCETFAVVTPSLPALSQPSPQIKSYKEWKSEKVQASASQVLETRSHILKAKTEANLPLIESLEKLQRQQQWNLEVANDLSVADYFVLYLSQQNQADRFRQAAPKLTASEVAELMEAYANTLGAQPSIDEKLPAQATQISDQIK